MPRHRLLDVLYVYSLVGHCRATFSCQCMWITKQIHDTLQAWANTNRNLFFFFLPPKHPVSCPARPCQSWVIWKLPFLPFQNIHHLRWRFHNFFQKLLVRTETSEHAYIPTITLHANKRPKLWPTSFPSSVHLLSVSALVLVFRCRIAIAKINK